MRWNFTISSGPKGKLVFRAQAANLKTNKNFLRDLKVVENDSKYETQDFSKKGPIGNDKT